MLGLIGDMQLGNSNFSFQPGMYYTAKGRKFSKNYDTSNMQGDSIYTVYQNTSLKLDYIEIPLNFAYHFYFKKDHRNAFFLSAGPYFAFMYSSSMSNQSLTVQNGSLYTYDNETDDLPIGKAVNSYKTFDIGVNGRAGFEFGNVVLCAYGSRGLTNFYNAPYQGTFHHQVFGASLGIWLFNSKPSSPIVKSKPKPRDSDHDGVPDDIDLCPHTPGLAKYHGCPIPDTDGDGIDDEHDSCKTVPGLARYHGCPIPDTDGDGINDEEDKCPTIPGVKENNGCPIINKEVREKLKYVSHNILFATASDQLTPGSFIALDELADTLKNHVELKLEINGYTDTVGTPERNILLSQKRSESVKAYLVTKGIPAERIIAIGHGQENPIADNTTESGKAANRRVELKLISSQK
jgi:outer membrane protein OmpA-like peptidoglycan-associated protein